MEKEGIIILTLALMVSGVFSTTFTFTNNCTYTVWPGVLTSEGSPEISPNGFELGIGAAESVDAPPSSSGRFWARTGCSTASGKFTCSSGDCGSGQITCNGAGAIPPATLVEFTLATSDGKDFYDVSLVDGFNLPLSVTPQGGSGCSSTGCPADVNSNCPSELSLKGSDGRTIACKSACEALNDPQYCCTGEYGSPSTCRPTDYSMIFKNACPQAYSYAYDDKSSTFTCLGGTNYLITFCP